MVLTAIPVIPARAAQNPGGERGAFALRWENDVFGGTDRNYTNGIGLALTRPGRGLLGGVWELAGIHDGRLFTTWELTQLQFTPADLTRSDPDPRDRPYAGVLYAGLASHLRRGNSLHSAKLILGMAGPASLAEPTQKLIHLLLNDPNPHGWDYQVKDEPILDLLYEYRHRFLLTPEQAPLAVDCIPMAGGMLGNYLTQLQAQLQFRVGRSLPDDFGGTVLREAGFLPPPDSSRRWGGYLFAGGGAALVAHDLTLDGNTFAHSRSVEKRPLVPRGEVGTALHTPWCRLTFSFQLWGRTFHNQRKREDFGSLLLNFDL